MAGKQILTDEMTIVNIFRNMPVAVHARHILQLPDSSAQCLDGDLAFNDAFCQMTGYTPREIEALFENCLDRMVLEADRAQLMQEIHALCAYPHEGTVSFRVTVKDGRRMRVEERMRSIRQADGSVWLYAVVMDAREDKQQMPVPQEQKRVTVQTFGYLNILIDGEPVVFEHEKAKELLALLIDRQGKFVSSGEIISCLWEDEAVNENTQSRCRKAAYHLRRILAAHDLEDLMESTPKGYRRVRMEMIDCDLYHYLNGEEAYVNRFRGAYMSDYSWAEQTLTMLVYGK
ncbi:MAG: PAS domain-containing protein [Clostridiales bacterium]|nr:PAS domain-containing protein [Clostridiales bacterium]